MRFLRIEKGERMAKLLIEYDKALRSVGVRDVEECMGWAFGRAWETMYLKDAALFWNAGHGDLFMLVPKDGIIESLKKIGIAYLERETNWKERFG